MARIGGIGRYGDSGKLPWPVICSFLDGPVWRDSMAKSALIAMAVAFLLGGTSLAAANPAGTHRSPSHPGVNERVTASSRPTAANPYYRLSDEYYGYSDPYRGLYDFLAVPPYIPGYTYGHTRMPVR
jgi:hypothetical protein